MLNQNWFQDERFIMFEEYGQKGSTIIQEITPDSFEHTPNYNRYKKFIGIKVV